MPTHLSEQQLARDLAVRDLTDPSHGPHAIQLLIEAAVTALVDAWGCGVRWCRGSRVVPVTDNYDALLIEGQAVTRDSRYTRYVDDQHMLRSHSSAMVPPALRQLAAEAADAADPADDVLLVCPGIVYRRDAIDWQHTGTPHQLDLWRVRRRGSLGESDLDQMIDALAGTLAPARPYRWEPRLHPYTRHGRQVDVAWDERWVEVWECGLAHPDVLAGAGLNGSSGLALGMGLDRLLMLRKGIPDIRALRSNDTRITTQMTDLEPYQPVSSMPPIQRDLSIAVDRSDEAEDLGDRVRDALGEDADAVEEVAVLARASYEDLPAAARSRLGISDGQENLLIRVVLRHLERTLTNQEANHLRDRVYAALHRGTTHQWAGPRAD